MTKHRGVQSAVWLGMAALLLLLAQPALAGYRWPRDGRRTGTNGYDYFVDRSGSSASEALPSGEFAEDPGSNAAVGKDPATGRWIVRPAPGVCAKLALHPVGSAASDPASVLGLVARARGGGLSVTIKIVGSDGSGNPDMTNVGQVIKPRTVYKDGELVTVFKEVNEIDWTNSHWFVVEVDDPSNPCDGTTPDGDSGGRGQGDVFPPGDDDTTQWPPWEAPPTPPSGGIVTASDEAPLYTFTNTRHCLLLSRVVVTPTTSEFVEIYNPNPYPLPLEEFYLSNTNTYFYLPEKTRDSGTTRATGGSNGIFNARFPEDAWILPFEYLSVALSGSANFKTLSNGCPDYELYDDGNNDCSSTKSMRESFSGGINGQGTLANADGHMALYFWDTEDIATGAVIPDLVKDCDLLNWGDDVSLWTDKSGISLDGPDSDTTESTYATETGISSQDTISSAPHAEGFTFARSDFSEGTEKQSASANGWLPAGPDETSENLSATWASESLPASLSATGGSSGGCALLRP